MKRKSMRSSDGPIPSETIERISLSGYSQDVYVETYKDHVIMRAISPGGGHFVVWMSAVDTDRLVAKLKRAAERRRAIDAARKKAARRRVRP